MEKKNFQHNLWMTHYHSWDVVILNCSCVSGSNQQFCITETCWPRREEHSYITSGIIVSVTGKDIWQTRPQDYNSCYFLVKSITLRTLLNAYICLLLGISFVLSHCNGHLFLRFCFPFWNSLWNGEMRVASDSVAE